MPARKSATARAKSVITPWMIVRHKAAHPAQRPKRMGWQCESIPDLRRSTPWRATSRPMPPRLHRERLRTSTIPNEGPTPESGAAPDGRTDRAVEKPIKEIGDRITKRDEVDGEVEREVDRASVPPREQQGNREGDDRGQEDEYREGFEDDLPLSKREIDGPWAYLKPGMKSGTRPRVDYASRSRIRVLRTPQVCGPTQPLRRRSGVCECDLVSAPHSGILLARVGRVLACDCEGD